MAKSETEKSANRLALHFCRTAGVHLGILDDPRAKTPAIKMGRDAHFKEIELEFMRLLKSGWSESELEVGIFQAFRDKKKESLPYKLFLGKTPIANRNNPNRNLLEDVPKEELIFHPEIAHRRMPRISISKGKAQVTTESRPTEWVKSYTLRELRHYWEKNARNIRLEQTGDEADKAFSWLLDKYNVSYILKAIDVMFANIPDRPQAGISANILKLKAYISLLEANKGEVIGWL